MPDAPLPVYGLGDSYKFSDGDIRTVIAADPDQVKWRDNEGEFVTARDVLLPPLAWADSVVNGRRTIGAGLNLLFPLQADKSVQFTATRIVSPARGGVPVTTRENWGCSVAGAVPVDTPAGRFNTWQVNCIMSTMPSTASTGTLQLTFFYAPDIGFYVRREERVGDGPPRVTNLVSYSTAAPALPQTVLRRRSEGIQRALEHLVSGEHTDWSDISTGDSGDVLVLNTKHSTEYGWCRDFTERIRASGRLYEMHGTGCRNPAGIWQLVELAPGASGRS